VERLAAIAGLTVLNDNAQQQGVWPVLYVLLPSEQARDSALARLWSAGHGVGRMFIHALPDYPAVQHLFDTSDVPNARDFAARSLTISNSPWLLEDDFSRICSILEQSIG
jgi:dTDP-4-amino-4,6-dideoxygalactose transaminase